MFGDNFIHIYEVGPRDGLQNEATPVDTPTKISLIDGLVKAGLRRIEATSFVHPRAVPQMADAEHVMGHVLEAHAETPAEFFGLTLNEKGYDRALTTGCRWMACGVAVSETFSRENTRMSTQQAFETVERLVARAKQDGVFMRVYLMTAWVCPFEGPVNPQKTLAFAQRLIDMGVDELAVADTIGYAHPLEVGQLMEAIRRDTPAHKLAIHLHDTQAMGLANAQAALSAGVRIFDTSIGGLGGCPFAPGAAGNLATEDLVFFVTKMGYDTGINLHRLWDVVTLLDEAVARPVGGRTRAWWRSDRNSKPEVAQP